MRTLWVPMSEILNLAQQPEGVDPTTSYPWAGILNRGRGLFHKGLLPGSATSYKTLFRLRKDQIVYSKLFGWEGAIARVTSGFDGSYVSSEFPTFDVDLKTVSPSFLEQVLKSDLAHAQMASSANGLGQRRQRVNVDAFLNIHVPLPPRPEQDRIATHLARLEAPATQATPDHWVVTNNLIAAVARASEWASLGSLMALRRDWIELTEGTYHPIGIRGFGRGMIRYPATGIDGLSKLRYFRVRPGALLVSNIKAWEGAVTLAEDGDWARVASNRFLQYEPCSDRVTAGWVADYLRSPEGTAQLSAVSPGSADRNRTLSIAGLESVRVPVPNRETQDRIARFRRHGEALDGVIQRRDSLSAALLPAARNEIFNAMR